VILAGLVVATIIANFLEGPALCTFNKYGMFASDVMLLQLLFSRFKGASSSGRDGCTHKVPALRMTSQC
jgi:hypothetical protein